MKRALLAGFILLFGLLAGCAADQGHVDDGKPHAECTVCKMNVDLACIDVSVDDKTPKYLFNGKTYYFCSDDCKVKFEKEPGKYAK